MSKVTKYVFEVQTGFVWKANTDGSTKVKDYTVIASDAIEACQKVLKLSGVMSDKIKDFGVITVERKDKIDA